MRTRPLLLLASLVGLLAFAVVGAAATPAYGYGKATYQATLQGTFNFPGTGNAFGFWGWCDFAGGITSGNDADCQISEYSHGTTIFGNVPFNCELAIDANFWDGSGSTLEFVPEPAFAVTGTAVVHPSSLSPVQQEECLEAFGSFTGTTFQSVNTFIPVVPGHYDFKNVLRAFFPGAVGTFSFNVRQIP